MILDGFPRTIKQAEKLDEILDKDNQKITHAVNLKIDDTLLIERIAGRRVHLASGRSYHVKFNPPKVEGKDDITGEPLIQRKDDTEEILKTRMNAFHSQTAPIIDYYNKKGLLTTVDANQKINQVWAGISGSLNKI